jgi:hypothetical protein
MLGLGKGFDWKSRDAAVKQEGTDFLAVRTGGNPIAVLRPIINTPISANILSNSTCDFGL